MQPAVGYADSVRGRRQDAKGENLPEDTRGSCLADCAAFFAKGAVWTALPGPRKKLCLTVEACYTVETGFFAGEEADPSGSSKKKRAHSAR